VFGTAGLGTLPTTPLHTCPPPDGRTLPYNEQCSSAPDVVGAFRFICNAGQLKADDPIVYPGQPGKSHLHQFYGNDEANAYSTYASLRQSGNSTCMVPTPFNRSSYWMPALLDGLGNVVKPKYVSIYYKRRPRTDPKCGGLGTVAGAQGKCIPIPNGLKFVYGFDMLTGKAPTGSGYYNCQSPDSKNPIPGVVAGSYPTLEAVAPFCPVGALLGIVLKAPNCVNGKDLDSPNHRDHVAYMVRDQNSGQISCPATHPYVIADFTQGAWYPVTSPIVDPVTGVKWSLSSDAMHPELPKGATLHGDFFMAWEPDVHDLWEDWCLDKMLNCAAGILGNGQYIPGALIRNDPSPTLVPLSSLGM
jgi:hypothetical protein